MCGPSYFPRAIGSVEAVQVQPICRNEQRSSSNGHELCCCGGVSWMELIWILFAVGFAKASLCNIDLQKTAEYQLGMAARVPASGLCPWVSETLATSLGLAGGLIRVPLGHVLLLNK